jgi:hypothetical protein
MNELNLTTSRTQTAAQSAAKTQAGWYVAYYAVLFLVVAGYAVTTVFHGSKALVHADRVAQAEKEKSVLVRQHLELKEKIAQQQSLNKVALHENVLSYQSINQPLVVTDHAAVALR